MTESEAREHLIEILKSLSVSRGDTVYLGVDMAALPLPKNPAKLTAEGMLERFEKWCEFTLNCLLDYLGPDGTIIVPTFSYDYAAPGKIYNHQETPSDVGPFTEYVRRHSQSIRSLHPIFSLAGIGKHARDILCGLGKSAFGPLSSFGRLPGYGVRFVCLGVPFSQSITYLHTLEQMHGCNHRFNKILESKVMSHGIEVIGPWMAYLSFRGFAQGADFAAMENRLRQEGALLETSYRGRPYQSVIVTDVDIIGFKMLDENPCAFATYDAEVRLDEDLTAQNPVTGYLAEFVLNHKNQR